MLLIESFFVAVGFTVGRFVGEAAILAFIFLILVWVLHRR